MDAAFILAWQYSVGLVFPEDLPMAAAELPAEGQDSRALRDLAGRSRNDDTAELQDLLREAMAEMRVPVPDDDTAERCLLHHLAARLIAGGTTMSAAPDPQGAGRRPVASVGVAAGGVSRGGRSGGRGGEVVALVEVLDQAGLGRLPAEQFAGVRA